MNFWRRGRFFLNSWNVSIWSEKDGRNQSKRAGLHANVLKTAHNDKHTKMTSGISLKNAVIKNDLLTVRLTVRVAHLLVIFCDFLECVWSQIMNISHCPKKRGGGKPLPEFLATFLQLYFLAILLQMKTFWTAFLVEYLCLPPLIQHFCKSPLSLSLPHPLIHRGTMGTFRTQNVTFRWKSRFLFEAQNRVFRTKLGSLRPRNSPRTPYLVLKKLGFLTPSFPLTGKSSKIEWPQGLTPALIPLPLLMISFLCVK